MVKLKTISGHRMFPSAIGAALTVLCGLALWQMPLGEALVKLSYDYLFRFSARSVTNEVVVVFMDNEAHQQLQQERGAWDRAIHARFLNKLADDGARLVAFDLRFRELREPEVDRALAEAMRRHSRLILASFQSEMISPRVEGFSPDPPADFFLQAAGTNWGVAWLDPDLGDYIVRRHWPFPLPGPYESLPWGAARMAGAVLPKGELELWLRYYDPGAAWTSLSYSLALAERPGYFRDKIVFIGNKPGDTVPNQEEDEFRTPHIHWTGESWGGVEILATAFLNLMNREYLQRPSAWIEIGVLLIAGFLLGWFVVQLRTGVGLGVALGAAALVLVSAVLLTHFTNYWFPWLIIAGAQVPCAALCMVGLRRLPRVRGERATDYEIIEPPFAEGAYGTVALARNAIGQWQALKTIYQKRFGEERSPYEREFRGITRYKPISDKHPGLLRVDFVSRMKAEGYFYYVMELGDSQVPGWQADPVLYKPCDLAHLRGEATNGRLPIHRCVSIGVALSDALAFLHDAGVIHRDIKPSNVIFVEGRPKLADVGLVAEVKVAPGENTQVGTPGYMPPPPEPAGTVQADIYALGMVLYVISTGRKPAAFPELSATLLEATGHKAFLRLNEVILRACHPEVAQRYRSAAELHGALLELERSFTPEEASAAR